MLIRNLMTQNGLSQRILRSVRLVAGAYDSKKIESLRSEFEARKNKAAEDFDKRRQDTLNELFLVVMN